MITDARTLAEVATIAADICIVGAGPAGLTLATELAKKSGVQILLIESGGLDLDPETQALNQGIRADDNYVDPSTIRARGFAGTAHLWNTPVKGTLGAKYVPLDEIDFEKRDWVPHSGWPFDRQHLNPFYERAHQRCGLGPFQYGLGDWSADPHRPWNMEGTDARSGLYQLGSVDVFRKDAQAAVRDAQNIQCLLYANVTEIEMAPPGEKVTGLKIVCLNGRTLKATASTFVLAAGAIENPRLLLASDSVQKGGIGNRFDCVGRYFMDHPVYYFTRLRPDDAKLFEISGFYDLQVMRGTTILGRLGVSPEAMRRDGLLNASIVLYPKIPGYRSRGIEALRQLRIAFRERAIPPQLFRKLANLIVGAPDLAAYAIRSARVKTVPNHGWSNLENNAGRYATFEPEFYLEQSPDPQNRITLANSRDRLGMRQAEIHWRWNELDARSAERTRQIVDESLAKKGIGHLDLLKFWRLRPSAHHPAGTTRMHADERQGVVDENCRVHGTANLYVTGPSVFPTCGYANPMLTIVALALRLADHLQ
jgi:choline dehydrogenase-like flavoprotein